MIIRRGDFYRELWAEPMGRVAARYGVSDTALIKICPKRAVKRPSKSRSPHRALRAHAVARGPQSLHLRDRRSRPPRRSRVRSLLQLRTPVAGDSRDPGSVCRTAAASTSTREAPRLARPWRHPTRLSTRRLRGTPLRGPRPSSVQAPLRPTGLNHDHVPSVDTRVWRQANRVRSLGDATSGSGRLGLAQKTARRNLRGGRRSTNHVTVFDHGQSLLRCFHSANWAVLRRSSRGAWQPIWADSRLTGARLQSVESRLSTGCSSRGVRPAGGTMIRPVCKEPSAGSFRLRRRWQRGLSGAC